VAQSSLSATIGYGIYGCITLLWLLPTILAIADGFKRLSEKAVNGILIASGLAVTIATGINGYVGQPTFFALLASLLLLPFITLLSAKLMGKAIFHIGIRSIVQYCLCASPVNLMVNVYAFCNMHDASWGTKGLSKDSSEHSELLNDSLRQFSSRFLSVWLCTNIALFIMVIKWSLLYSAMAFISLFLVLYFLLGLCGCLQLRNQQGNRAETAKKGQTENLRKSAKYS
jgi:hypothetical protein